MAFSHDPGSWGLSARDGTVVLAQLAGLWHPAPGRRRQHHVLDHVRRYVRLRPPADLAELPGLGLGRNPRVESASPGPQPATPMAGEPVDLSAPVLRPRAVGTAQGAIAVALFPVPAVPVRCHDLCVHFPRRPRRVVPLRGSTAAVLFCRCRTRAGGHATLDSTTIAWLACAKSMAGVCQRAGGPRRACNSPGPLACGRV